MGTITTGYDSDLTNGTQRELDEASTMLYRLGQATAGDADPDVYAELERFTPEELGTTDEQAVIDAGRLILLASDALGAALRRLNPDAEPETPGRAALLALAASYGHQDTP